MFISISKYPVFPLPDKVIEFLETLIFLINYNLHSSSVAILIIDLIFFVVYVFKYRYDSSNFNHVRPRLSEKVEPSPCQLYLESSTSTTSSTTILLHNIHNIYTYMILTCCIYPLIHYIYISCAYDV